jgi:hypothetical protein
VGVAVQRRRAVNDGHRRCRADLMLVPGDVCRNIESDMIFIRYLDVDGSGPCSMPADST